MNPFRVMAQRTARSIDLEAQILDQTKFFVQETYQLFQLGWLTPKDLCRYFQGILLPSEVESYIQEALRLDMMVRRDVDCIVTGLPCYKVRKGGWLI